jgi:hypothetical protein
MVIPKLKNDFKDITYLNAEYYLFESQKAKAAVKEQSDIREHETEILAVSREKSADGARKSSPTDVLLELARENSTELFHDQDHEAYANIFVDGHNETLAVEGVGFKDWIREKYYRSAGRAPGKQALEDAIQTLASQARYKGVKKSVNLRAACHENKLYLDTGDSEGNAIEISDEGWKISNKVPVLFKRPIGMEPLPQPEKQEDIKEGVALLRTFLNVRNDDDFVLVVAWMLAALRNEGPYPILNLSGEQGSAKSSFCKVLSALVDPNRSPIRTLQTKEQDIFISTQRSRVLMFDNVSRISGEISDALCRLATGGTFSARKLYSDNEEVMIRACCPVVLNGIVDNVIRPDLSERCIHLHLEHISEEDRKPEKEMWAKFEEARPKILGALLSAMSHGLKNLPETKLEKSPRMSDFAIWATACEEALWDPGSFMRAYNHNRDEAITNNIESNPVATEILFLMKDQNKWEGTATDLCKCLSFPENHCKFLSSELKRIETMMRHKGILFSKERRGNAGTRIISIIRT